MPSITALLLLLLLAAIVTHGLPYSLGVGEGNDSLNVTKGTMDDEVNLPEIMALCNESFRIRFDHMQEFNSSGSLPDETDKTPMCFMRCVLEKTQVLTDGVLNKSRVTELLWPATGDSVEACQAEGDLEEHPCQKAYAIARCMMTRALVDAKNKTAD